MNISYLALSLALSGMGGYAHHTEAAQPPTVVTALQFSELTSGSAPFYYDKKHQALAINASNKKFREKFAQAVYSFPGPAGTYTLVLTTLGEVDGECNYRVKVNDQIVGKIVNKPTNQDYAPQRHTLAQIAIPADAKITVEADARSNGKIPENDAFAFARGRWTSLTFTEMEPASLQVESFTLINAGTEKPVPGFDPIPNGSVINTTQIGTRALNLRANTTATDDFGSVQISLTGSTECINICNKPLWTLFGTDTKNMFYEAGCLNAGPHTLTATAYRKNEAAGEPGTTNTICFDVVSPESPVVSAGPDQTVPLPTDTVTLTGTANDDGSIVSVQWDKLSGPDSITMTDKNSALTITDWTPGNYLFRFSATDNEGLHSEDLVRIHALAQSKGTALITGETKQWHKITLAWDGPQTAETASPNPFSDYRLDVIFYHPATARTYVVPGFYAADGLSADSHATSGNRWCALFSPDATGEWLYRASFRTGQDVAIQEDLNAGISAGYFDGDQGSFLVAASDKTGRDFRGRGRLNYVGRHHLQFAGDQSWFLKSGADAPENLLAYDDFDATPSARRKDGSQRKSWKAHERDFDAASGQPFTWAEGQGTELLGAVKYLHDKGLNSFSFLTFNVDGDDDNVFPHLLTGSMADYEQAPDNKRWKMNWVYHDRFDVSKMAQWERLFEYGEQLGMYLHFKTLETENELTMDHGNMGRERNLYYRELIARFGHHLALNWNLGEEINSASTEQKQSWANFFAAHDPYHHHLVIHNMWYYHDDLLGAYDAAKKTGSTLTGFSLQTHQPDFGSVFGLTKGLIDRSDAAGRPWVVPCDEPGDAMHALRPAGDEGDSWETGRKNALWGNVMAGGAGCEFYFGYQHAHSDMTCEDWRTRDGFWDYCRFQLAFFKNNAIPFQDMHNEDALISNRTAWCLSNDHDTYVIYLKEGGTTEIDLTAATGPFTVSWYNPRTGGPLQSGTVRVVNGGKKVELGHAQTELERDWVILVRRNG